MPFRADVLKGVRLAAILFVVFLIALTVSRMVRVTPAEDRQEPPAPAVSSASPVVVESPRFAPVYPPPPPPPGAPAQIHRVVRKRSPVAAAKPMVVAKDVSADSAAEGKGEITVSEGKSAITEEKDASEVASSKIQNPESNPEDTPEAAARPNNAGKRWLKAVGRFLHIGAKKDIPVEAVR